MHTLKHTHHHHTHVHTHLHTLSHTKKTHTHTLTHAAQKKKKVTLGHKNGGGKEHGSFMGLHMVYSNRKTRTNLVSFIKMK
jgi:hypothetical protein